MNSTNRKSRTKWRYIGNVASVALAAGLLWGAWAVSNGEQPPLASGVWNASAHSGATASAGAGPNALRVNVSGVRSSAGTVIGSLCREGELFPSECSLNASAVAAEGVVSLDFGDLDKGDYALALYHDENGNSQLELGTEGIGFSNNANLAQAPPEFEKSRIKVEGVTRIRVRIRYSL